MIPDDPFTRDLERYLDGRAGNLRAGYLEEALARTSGTSQRRWWSSPERWLPMTLVIPRRVAPARSGLTALAVVTLLLLALVTLALIGGTRPRQLGPGLAENGLIAFVDGPAIKVANADGSSVRPIVTGLADGTNTLRWSPDGTRLAYRGTGGDGTVEIVNADGSGHVSVPAPLMASDNGLAWAPDSRRLVFTEGTADGAQLAIVAADGSGLIRLQPAGPVRARILPSWSADGSVIGFVDQSVPDGGAWQLALIRPDGTDERILTDAPRIAGDVAMGWGGFAPDPAHRRLLYVSGDNVSSSSTIEIYDVDRGASAIVDQGFWPSWSPDGSSVAWWNDGLRAADTDLVVSPHPSLAPRLLQPAMPHGSACQDNPELASRAICSPGVFSPDGRWIIGPNATGSLIVALPVDRAHPTIELALEHPIDLASTPGFQVAWQPVAP